MTTASRLRKLDRQRQRHEESLDMGMEDDHEPRLTMQGLSIRNAAICGLNRSIAILRSLLHGCGATIEVKINGLEMNRWGKEYRSLRAICLRSELVNLNYYHSKVKQLVDIDHMERDIQSLREGVDEVLNGNGD